tara:strand:- start:529 stop:765 length:237 start_codon:yes stop_codon:yes gene_type:complete
MEIESLYHHFIKSNAELYDIDINTIFKEFNLYLESQNYFLPICNANDLHINTIRQGKDFGLYIVKSGSDKTNYWKKIN